MKANSSRISLRAKDLAILEALEAVQEEHKALMIF